MAGVRFGATVTTAKRPIAALGRRDKQALLALVAEDLEWAVPGEDWPPAGTYRGVERST